MMFNEEFYNAGLYRVNTRCEKWDGCREEHGDVLPMWVADMDFQSPPAVQEALLRRAAHPTYGYTQIKDDDYEALINFWQRRHNFSIAKEEMTFLPCVISGMKQAILATTEPGDGVIIQSPLYGPFEASLKDTGRTVLDAPLLQDDKGYYSMNLSMIEQYLRDGAKLFLLCNPHNPVSRVWRKEELVALLELVRKYNVPLVSDEIHADFVYAPNEFTPVLSLETKNVVSLCAASKTFNLAGLQQACLVCKDEALREAIRKQISHNGVVCANVFALEGTRAAYNHGDAWLDGLLEYLEGNRQELVRLVAEHLPDAVLTPMEGTYLAWINLSHWGYDCNELEKRTIKAGVAFVKGTYFGEKTGEMHIRFNIACPRAHIEEAILRLKVALES